MAPEPIGHGTHRLQGPEGGPQLLEQGPAGGGRPGLARRLFHRGPHPLQPLEAFEPRRVRDRPAGDQAHRGPRERELGGDFGVRRRGGGRRGGLAGPARGWGGRRRRQADPDGHRREAPLDRALDLAHGQHRLVRDAGEGAVILLQGRRDVL